MKTSLITETKTVQIPKEVKVVTGIRLDLSVEQAILLFGILGPITNDRGNKILQIYRALDIGLKLDNNCPRLMEDCPSLREDAEKILAAHVKAFQQRQQK